MITKSELQKELKLSIGKIKFRKKDETIREMSCTLSENFLPKLEWSKEQKSLKTENEEVVSVWDLDKLAWRSFRLDSLLDYSFEKIK